MALLSFCTTLTATLEQSKDNALGTTPLLKPDNNVKFSIIKCTLSRSFIKKAKRLRPGIPRFRPYKIRFCQGRARQKKSARKGGTVDLSFEAKSGALTFESGAPHSFKGKHCNFIALAVVQRPKPKMPSILYIYKILI